MHITYHIHNILAVHVVYNNAIQCLLYTSQHVFSTVLPLLTTTTTTTPPVHHSATPQASSASSPIPSPGPGPGPVAVGAGPAPSPSPSPVAIGGGGVGGDHAPVGASLDSIGAKVALVSDESTLQDSYKVAITLTCYYTVN